jgi:hypothetical protein
VPRRTYWRRCTEIFFLVTPLFAIFDALFFDKDEQLLFRVQCKCQNELELKQVLRVFKVLGELVDFLCTLALLLSSFQPYACSHWPQL